MQAEQTQAEQTQAEQMQSQEEQSKQAALPYRTILKDVFNKMYADSLKKTFQYLPSNIQTDFEKFTQNLMQEEYISRNSLLDAIRDFNKTNISVYGNRNWSNFSDNAWNYRPYQ
jgi:hypothetical protein